MGSVPLAIATPDIVVLVVVLLFLLNGLWKGMVWTLVRFAGMVGGFFLAARFDAPVGRFLAEHLSFVSSGSADMVGWVTIVVLVYVFALIAAHVLRGAVRDVKLGGLDRLLGAAFGAALGFGICAFAFTLWASTKSSVDVKARFEGSVSAAWMARAVHKVTPLFSDGVRERWEPVFSSLD